MYKWIFLNGDKEQEEELIKSLNISPLLARLLVNRGINNKESAKNFLFPNLDNLYDPFLFFPKLENAIDYIIRLRDLKKKILIYGDYDADGITSTVLLLKFFRKMGWDVDYYIPHRLYEGYGLKKDTLQKLDLSKYSLIITVDCGINSIEEVDFLRNNGLEVIITDHHIPLKSNIPNALLVLNPHLNNYPFPYLAGVGVAFKFIQGICDKIGEKFINDDEIFELITLGTLGDQVELKDENRILVKIGLEKLLKTKSIGLKHLLRKAGLQNYSSLQTREVVYYLVPRLNAIGRLREVKDAVELLLSEEEDIAERLADILERENRERQRIKDYVMSSAEESIISYFEKEGEDVPIIIIFNEEWHKGVLGLTASDLCEKYNRPVFLGREEGDYIVFSGRGIEDTDIFDFISKLSHYLVRYGGHKFAVGFSIKKDNWLEFYNSVINLSKELWKDIDLTPKIKIDAEISINNINPKLFMDIEKISPFGPGNEEPNFLISGTTMHELSSLSISTSKSLEDLTFQKEKIIDIVVRISKFNIEGGNYYRLYLEDFKMTNKSPIVSPKKRKFRYLIFVDNDLEKNLLIEKIKKKRENISIITPSWNQEYWKDKELNYISPWEIIDKINILESSQLILWEDIELILKAKEFINYYEKLIYQVKCPIFFLTLLNDENTIIKLSKILDIKVVKYPSKGKIPSLRDLRFSKNKEKEKIFFDKIKAYHYPSPFPHDIVNHLVFYKPPLLISELRRWVRISKHSYLFFGKDEFIEGYKRIQDKVLELNPLEKEFFRKNSQDFLQLLQRARLSEIYSLLFQELPYEQ